MERSHHPLSELLDTGDYLRTQLNFWVEAVNTQDPNAVAELYANKSALFSTFQGLKNKPEDILNYFESAGIINVFVDEESISYDTETELIEGEYTFERVDNSLIRAAFAFRFDKEGKIIEHASAPKGGDWQVKKEVAIGVLLTSQTVQAVLKTNGDIEENVYRQRREGYIY